MLKTPLRPEPVNKYPTNNHYQFGQPSIPQRTVSAVILHKAFVDRELADRDRNTGWVEKLGMKKEHETRENARENETNNKTGAILCVGGPVGDPQRKGGRDRDPERVERGCDRQRDNERRCRNGKVIGDLSPPESAENTPFPSTADLPEGVFPETLKDFKTLDDTRASVCMTYYDLNGPNNVNMQLNIAAKRKLIANYIGVIWME
ncbi:hypothetical protein PILCRDRAFT_93350 [Piloderma croceum F 1598]|uniref:Uncharacterized protein n=1 Tax=Piloderma croceum (strain F 1598) TaxID=765440 RepID=A0A0C3EXL5_PILCF|nr:hypothetical protein PILCRDRAFT_93350 [Piloderma croceum F 1598]